MGLGLVFVLSVSCLSFEIPSQSHVSQNKRSKLGSGVGLGVLAGGHSTVPAQVPGGFRAQALGADPSPNTLRAGHQLGPTQVLDGEFHTVGPGLSSLDLDVGGCVCPVYYDHWKQMFLP